MGIRNEKNKKKNIIRRIKSSYAYKLFSKILSTFFSITLVLLLILGGLMFYFNAQSKRAQEKGMQYNPPFGLYTIISGSMEPKIHVYDVVASVEVKDISKIKVNDIVTFVSTWDIAYGKTITHRVVSISKNENGEYQLTTKGDNNSAADGAPVTQKNLVGKVLFKIPQLGRLQFYLATKMGWFLIVLVPALTVIIYDLIKIFKVKVLQENVDVIKEIDEADKTYFEGEKLENRDLTKEDLTKTLALNTKSIKSKLSEEKPKKKDQEPPVKVVKKTEEKKIERKPIKKKETKSTKTVKKETKSKKKK